MIPDTCFACVELGARLVEQVVLQKVVDWAHPMWQENHIYTSSRKANKVSPGWRLLCAVWRAAPWPREKRAGISLVPAFSLQNFVGLAAVVVPNVCGCGGIKLPNKWQASVGPLHLRKCL